jgi:hypothetical protein
MHGPTLRRDSNKEQSSRRNDQQNLTDHREECDERIAAEQQEVQPSGQHHTGR